MDYRPFRAPFFFPLLFQRPLVGFLVVPLGSVMRCRTVSTPLITDNPSVGGSSLCVFA
jgi:hypothetical protein